MHLVPRHTLTGPLKISKTPSVFSKNFGRPWTATACAKVFELTWHGLVGANNLRKQLRHAYALLGRTSLQQVSG